MKKIKELLQRMLLWIIKPIAHLLGGVDSKEKEGEKDGIRKSTDIESEKENK